MQSLIFYLAVSPQREAVNQQVQKLPITSDERSRTLPAEPVSPPIARSGSPQPHPPRSPSPHAGAPAGTQAGREEAPDKGVKREGAPRRVAPGAAPGQRAPHQEQVLATLARGIARPRCRPPGPAKGGSPGDALAQPLTQSPPPATAPTPPSPCSTAAGRGDGGTAPGPGAHLSAKPLGTYSTPGAPTDPAPQRRRGQGPHLKLQHPRASQPFLGNQKPGTSLPAEQPHASRPQGAQRQTRSFGEPLPSSRPLRF